MPQRWAEATLGDVADILRGVTYDKADARGSPAKGLIPIARATNIQNGQLNKNELVYVPEACVYPNQLLRNGDMVIATSSGSKSVVGKAARAGSNHTGMAFGAFCGVVRPIGDTIGDWIARVFEAPEYRSFVEAVAMGTNINNLRSRDLQSYGFPVAPEAEQRRIVARLDALTARLARARAELDRVPVLAARLREVALSSARQEASSSTYVRVQEVATITFDGPFGSNLKSADYVNEGVRVVRLENIGHLRFIREKESFISPQKYEGLKRHTLAPGDILFSSFVDREVRVCLFPDELGHIAINKADCFAVRPDLARCDPRYVAFLLASTETYEALKENVRGVTRPRIGLSQLRDYKIPLPMFEEQMRIADRIESAFARADRLEAEAARARALLDRLEAAILAKAFRGELVPQDPNDEHAQTLLDRIHQQRAAAPLAKRGRKLKEDA